MFLRSREIPFPLSLMCQGSLNLNLSWLSISNIDSSQIWILFGHFSTKTWLFDLITNRNLKLKGLIAFNDEMH